MDPSTTAPNCSLHGMNRWFATNAFFMAFNSRITQIACAILFVAGGACVGYLLYHGGYEVTSPEFLASLIGGSLGLLGLKMALIFSSLFRESQEVPLAKFETCKHYGEQEKARMQVQYFADGKKVEEKDLPCFASVKKYTGAEIFVDVMVLAQTVYTSVRQQSSPNGVKVWAVKGEVVSIEATKVFHILEDTVPIACITSTTLLNLKTKKATLTLSAPFALES